MVYGERLMLFAGEFHPFRLPVPDLWLDVFEKIKALGFNGVSFYVDWALLEGEQGVYHKFMTLIYISLNKSTRCISR